MYVDETGDRGFGPACSPFFAMTALMIPEENDWWMRGVASGLRGVIDTPKPLHWVVHFKPKHASRRRQAAEMLSRIPGAQLQHVIAHKASVNEDARMREDKDRVYNYVTKLLLERVAFAAKYWPGGSRLAIVRLGAVKHMDHDETRNYLDRVRATQGITPWDYIKWPPTWHNTEIDGIQLADLHAGMLYAALTGKAEDSDCAQNLLACRHQVRRRWDGQILNYGFKIIGDSGFVTDRCWWAELHR